jgi:hypothetical protein
MVEAGLGDEQIRANDPDSSGNNLFHTCTSVDYLLGCSSLLPSPQL